MTSIEQRFVRVLERTGNEEVWLPPVINVVRKLICQDCTHEIETGLDDAGIVQMSKHTLETGHKDFNEFFDHHVANIVQGAIEKQGAYDGQTNYKTRKRPTRFGKYEVEQGTFVANNHFKVDIEGTERIDPLTKKKYTIPTTEGIIDKSGPKNGVRILKLGRTVKRKHAPGWNRFASQSVDRVIEKIKKGECKFQKTMGDGQTERAGMVKYPMSNTNVSKVGGLSQ